MDGTLYGDSVPARRASGRGAGGLIWAAAFVLVVVAAVALAGGRVQAVADALRYNCGGARTRRTNMHHPEAWTVKSRPAGGSERRQQPHAQTRRSLSG